MILYRRALTVIFIGLLGASLPGCDRNKGVEADDYAGKTKQVGKALDPTAVPLNAEVGSSLPDENLPLKSIVDDLKLRAAKGEAQASCRLAAEYDYCAFQHQQLRKISKAWENIEIRDPDQSQKASLWLITSLSDLALKKADHCEDVEIPESGRRIDYWREAALKGHVSSMVAYSTGRVFHPRNTLTNLPQLETYKHEALRLAKKAALAGNLDAVFALAVAYTPDESDTFGRDLLAQVVRPDAKEALTLLYIIDGFLKTKQEPALVPLEKQVQTRIDRLITDLPQHDVRNALREATNRPQSSLYIGSDSLFGKSGRIHGFEGEAAKCDAVEFADNR